MWVLAQLGNRSDILPYPFTPPNIRDAERELCSLGSVRMPHSFETTKLFFIILEMI